MEREELYNHVLPPGDKIPSHIQRPPINNDHSTDQRLQQAVKRSHNGWVGGTSTMRAEDCNTWITVIDKEQSAQEKDKEGYKVADNTWRLLLRLIQTHVGNGRVPRYWIAGGDLKLDQEGLGRVDIGHQGCCMIASMCSGRLGGMGLNGSRVCPTTCLH